MSLFVKDPQARIDHAIDWSAWLAGQTLAASEWRVEPDEADGVTVEAAAFEAQPPESSGKQKSGDNCAENAQCWVARRKRVQGGEDDGRGRAYGNEGG